MQQSVEMQIDSAIKGELHCGHTYSLSPVGGQYLVMRNVTSSGATCLYKDMSEYTQYSIPCDSSTISDCSWSPDGACREEEIEDSLFDKLICPATLAELSPMREGKLIPPCNVTHPHLSKSVFAICDLTSFDPKLCDCTWTESSTIENKISANCALFDKVECRIAFLCDWNEEIQVCGFKNSSFGSLYQQRCSKSERLLKTVVPVFVFTSCLGKTG